MKELVGAFNQEEFWGNLREPLYNLRFQLCYLSLCRFGPPGDGGGHAAVECAGRGDQAEDGLLQGHGRHQGQGRLRSRSQYHELFMGRKKADTQIWFHSWVRAAYDFLQMAQCEYDI